MNGNPSGFSAVMRAVGMCVLDSMGESNVNGKVPIITVLLRSFEACIVSRAEVMGSLPTTNLDSSRDKFNSSNDAIVTDTGRRRVRLKFVSSDVSTIEGGMVRIGMGDRFVWFIALVASPDKFDCVASIVLMTDADAKFDSTMDEFSSSAFEPLLVGRRIIKGPVLCVLSLEVVTFPITKADALEVETFCCATMVYPRLSIVCEKGSVSKESLDVSLKSNGATPVLMGSVVHELSRDVATTRRKPSSKQETQYANRSQRLIAG